MNKMVKQAYLSSRNRNSLGAVPPYPRNSPGGLRGEKNPSAAKMKEKESGEDVVLWPDALVQRANRIRAQVLSNVLKKSWLGNSRCKLC